MEVRRFIIVYIILLSSLVAFSQESAPFWNLISYSGETSIMGRYRELETRRNDTYEFRKDSYFNGGIMLNTKSYFWHKNFFLLEANGEFNPGTRRQFNLVMPDRSEVRTYGSVDLRGTFFSENKFSIGGYLNLNQSFFNRETLTNIKSNNFVWGSFMKFDNEYLPITADFSQRKWEQSELPTGRVFHYEQNLLQAKATKSFYQTDKHELSYSHDDYKRTYSENSQVHNTIDKVRLYNNIYFDSEKKYNFSSTITNQNQRGSYVLKRLFTNENIRIKLPENFEFLGNYSYDNSQYLQQKQVRHRTRADIRHKLYLSLTSDLYYEYIDINRFVIHEKQHKAGVDFNYTKKIPKKGRLDISYSYYRLHNNTDGDPVSIYVINEEHKLTDGIIELLDKPNIDINSILVRDETGLIIYDENFDYTLIQRGSYYEIQRILGGQIPDGGTVIVDYSTTQPGSYKFDANRHHLYAGVSFYERLVTLYYRRIHQKHVNVYQTELLSLNNFNQNIFGIRLEYKFAQGGVEMDNYKSNIIPYKMMRYYLMLQKDFSKRVNCSLNGSFRDYDYEIDSSSVNQKFIDATGRVSYRFKDISTLNVEGGYRKNKGIGIDLDIIIFRTEVITNIRKLYFIVGFEMYKRNYLSEGIILNGGYFRIVRRF